MKIVIDQKREEQLQQMIKHVEEVGEVCENFLDGLITTREWVHKVLDVLYSNQEFINAEAVREEQSWVMFQTKLMSQDGFFAL